MATVIAPNLFKISDFNINLETVWKKSINEFLPNELTIIEPQFILPSLDEYSSGEERLLAGLRGIPKYRDIKFGNAKGNDKEVILVDQDHDVECDDEHKEEKEHDKELWLRLYDQVHEKEIGEPGPSRPRVFKPLRTWDTVFDRRVGESSNTRFISEEPLFTFDSLITINSPEISLPRLSSKPSKAPIDSNILLDLLLRSTLGMKTVGGVIWKNKENRFAWAIDGPRPVGIGKVTSASAITAFLDIATGLRRLEVIVDGLSPKPMTPTHHALLHSISAYLTYIKERLTSVIDQHNETNANWLKLIDQLSDIRELCLTLCQIMRWPLDQSKASSLPSQSSSLLTHLHAHFLAHFSTSSSIHGNGISTLALAYLLSRTSGPILHLLHQWVGLADSSTIDEDHEEGSQPWSDLGITRHAAAAASQRDKRNQTQSSHARWEYTFSSRKMPGFIPKSDRKTLFEAGKSLRLLREATTGSHPLCHGDWGLKGHWGWDGIDKAEQPDTLNKHLHKARGEIDSWRLSMRSKEISKLPSLSSTASLSSLRSRRKHRKNIPSEFVNSQLGATSSLAEQLSAPKQKEDTNFAELYDPLWDLVSQSPGAHFERKDNNFWGPTPISELKAFIEHFTMRQNSLLPPSSPSLPHYISSHLLAPLLAHAKLVSTSLVNVYLDDLEFLEHLEILKTFWLAGDVAFLERVNGALFGKNTAGAGEALGQGRRARTRARLGLAGGHGQEDRLPRGTVGDSAEQEEWGIGLGLGLSERSKWPPGGSELAYALRTTLVEDAVTFSEKGEVWDGIEDRVSFAIRELPEEAEGGGRRARWLDPQAIEALDFLYLSYSPGNAISTLLPRRLMEKYQTINNFLLRLGRVETVLKSMYFDVIHQYPDSEEIKIGVDSHPKRKLDSRLKAISSPVEGLFNSNFAIQRATHLLRFRMTIFITALTRYVIDTAIGTNYSIMQRRLKKLRRTHRKEMKSATLSSRPATPTTDAGSEQFQFDIDDLDVHLFSSNNESPQREDVDPLSQSDLDIEDEDEEYLQTGNMDQIQSVHSLVTYHHIILDRILRSCLLGHSQGQQVTFKILMKLFGLVLDFGKIIKEVERGIIDEEDGVEKVVGIKIEWDEKEKLFIHAIERLSQRSSSDETVDDGGEDEDRRGRDLDILLSAGELERNGEDDDAKRVALRDNGVKSRLSVDLQELVLRLKVIA